MDHEAIIALIEANRDLVPEGVYLGYAVLHTHNPDGTPIPDAQRIAADRDIKNNLRREVEVRGNKARSSDIPADATSAAGISVMLELMDMRQPGPPYPTLYRAVALSDLLTILNHPSMGAEQRRQAVRNYINTALSDLASRT